MEVKKKMKTKMLNGPFSLSLEPEIGVKQL